MKKYIYLFLLLFVSVTAGAQRAKYVFMFIGDGMGLNQVNLTEIYRAVEDGKTEPAIKPLLFSTFPVASFATSYSSSSRVTDSAAAGTALACGKKTYNGAIGCDKENTFVSIAEVAKAAGRKVAILTTVGMNHATPASFYAHQPSRNMYYEIAEEAISSNFDFLGGGDVISPTKKYDKTSAPDMRQRFEEAGMTVARGLEDYKAKSADAKRMVLLNTRPNSTSVPYAIDREAQDITLRQMTECAIDFLEKGGAKKGFFMMVEGGRIDQAGHSNDPGACVREVVDMDEAVAAAYEFYKKHPKETLILVTADHETGGLGLAANGQYALDMNPLVSQTLSFDMISRKITDLRKQYGKKATWENVKEVLAAETGLFKTHKVTWAQEKALRDAFEESFVNGKVVFDENMYSSLEPLASVARKVLCEQAVLGFTSTGHTAAYVPVFVIGAGQELFCGKMDNTDIPKKMAKAAGLKL